MGDVTLVAPAATIIPADTTSSISSPRGSAKYQIYIFLLVIDIPGSLGAINTLKPRQNGRYFADDIFKYIFLNENVWIPIKISLKFVARDLIDNILALVEIMAWRRPGDKPFFEPMMLNLTDVYMRHSASMS